MNIQILWYETSCARPLLANPVFLGGCTCGALSCNPNKPAGLRSVDLSHTRTLHALLFLEYVGNTLLRNLCNYLPV